MLDTSEANFPKLVLRESVIISRELMILGMSQTTLPVRYTAFAPVTVASHNKGTTVQLHGLKDADPPQMMYGAISHSSHSLIGYNLRLYGSTC
ncbi:hypothetical protein Har1130_18900 [Haloarcula sp. CBA1130]|nr:hypothetical protein Har1130_18900 [Haloarcula sp. CBA1130]